MEEVDAEIMPDDVSPGSRSISWTCPQCGKVGAISGIPKGGGVTIDHIDDLGIVGVYDSATELVHVCCSTECAKAFREAA